tara:strand:- start:802 stop:1137 length:336 start_codon:yes stop_codon:yes gene_type:complete
MKLTNEQIEEAIDVLDNSMTINIPSREFSCGRVVRALDSAIKALEMAKSDGWQPIENAPKDGALFLIPYVPTGVSVAKYLTDEQFLMVESDTIMHNPTKWMPMPLPQKESE